MTERVAAAGAEPWGDDPKLDELLGVQGAVEFRALLDGFPDAVGVLWALRDARGRIVDFAFGYGNPTMLRAFRLPAATRERYTLLEALPRMRGSRAFDSYVRVCESGEPWVKEVTYDTPFGDGYRLGTFVNRTAKLGDGIVNFLTDVTEQRRMEAELRSYAAAVAHDFSQPVAGIPDARGAARASRGAAAVAGSAAAVALERGASARSDRRRAGLRAGGRADLGARRARRTRRRGGRGLARAAG